MSLYLILFLILIVGVLIEYYMKHTPKELYAILFFALLLVLCFRYGQGSDYFGYYNNYLMTPAFESISSVGELTNSDVHGEIGWLLICSIFRAYNVPFEILIAIIGVVDMYCLARFIKKYCPQKILALFLSFPTLYLTYFFSGLRQGLVIAIFLGFLLEFIIRKKYAKYVLVVVLCTLLHSMAIVLMVIPILNIIRCNLVQYSTIVFICFAIGAFLMFTPIMEITSYGSDTYSVVAIFERIISLWVVLYCGHVLYKQDVNGDDSQMDIFMRTYLYGTMLYGLLWSSALVSSRICIPFKCMEIAIFSKLSTKDHNIRTIVLIFCLLITTMMFLKNIDSYINQGDYYEFVNIFNYPYVSIFDCESISYYKEIEYSLFK